MIEFIKTVFGEGDTIYISQKGQEVGGRILSINDAFIVIETEDGNIIGVKEDAIDSFSKEPVRKPCKNLNYNNRNPEFRAGSKSSDAWTNRSSNPQSRYQDYSVKNAKQERPEKPKFKQYKPGDRIPLEFLTQRDPALANSWKRMEEERKKSHQIKDAMKQAFEEIKLSEDDLQSVVPAIGAIVELKPTYQFGFIDDMQTGERYFYNRGDIVDPELKNESGEGIQVVYQRGRNHKGATAKCILLSQTIERVIEIAMELVSEDDFLRAKLVLQNITDAFPNGGSGQKMLDTLNDLLEENGIIESSQYDALYSQARRALEQRDYAKALKLYNECLEKGVRKVNCIKEIAQVFISLHAQERDEEQKELIKKRGLEFIEKHKNELPDKSSTKFSLENIYFALGDYDKHIDVVEDIITESGSNGDLAQYVFYLNKAAQSYLRIKDYERALDAANQGLEVEPQNTHLLKTKASIEEAAAGKKEEEDTKKSGGGMFGFLKL